MACGPAWGDFDNDGDLDLFVPYYSSTNVMFINNGDGTFSFVDIGSPIRDGINDQSAVWVDYDNDGFLDLFVASGENNPSPNLLYRNNLPVTGNRNHWLKVQLVGTTSNRSGIGARIRVRAVIHDQEVSQLRQIDSNGIYSMGTEFVAHFGLGDAAHAEVLRIEWPSGTVQEMHDVSANQMLTVTEPAYWMTMRSPGIIQICSRRGEICVVKGSSDLIHWTTLGMATNTTGKMEFVDPEAEEWRQRFYKAERFD